MPISRRILFCIAVGFGFSAMGQTPDENEFPTAEEFFGEDLLQQIEEMGIPYATHGWLLPEMFDAAIGSRPERVIENLEINLCTLPLDLTLHFSWREYVPDAILAIQHSEGYVEMSELHGLEGPCESSAVLELIQEPPNDEPSIWEFDPDQRFEIEIDNFHLSRSWRSRH